MNSASTLDVSQTLDAWREQGVDRLDPVRFQFIQAMAQRAAGLTDGEAKRRLDARLAELVQQYAARVEATVATTSSASAPHATPSAGLANSTSPAMPSGSMLSGLLKHLASLTPSAHAPQLSHPVGNLKERYPELPVLDEFRATWSRVSANRQVRQSEEQVHENAGPLNSNHLVHRALSMMRDVSPGYLHQFLSYLDTLAWVEQLHMSSEPPAKESKRGAAKSTKGSKSAAATKAKKKASKTES